MKGVLLALSTVIVWAILNVVNRFCVLQYDVNIMVFTSFMIFATGVTLMIIRKQVIPQNWKSGVKYSWLYTIMQIIRSFTMISTFLYITSTETSLLFNIEIIITYILAYAIFRRIPYKGDFLGILIILLGFILFIFSLPVHMRVIVSILVLLSATASCIRSIVVEETTIWNPHKIKKKSDKMKLRYKISIWVALALAGSLLWGGSVWLWLAGICAGKFLIRLLLTIGSAVYCFLSSPWYSLCRY